MHGKNTVLIASSSKAVIDYVRKRVDETGARNDVVEAQNADGLRDCLMRYDPEYLLIEGSFYHDATPEELHNIIKRYDSLRVYVFGINEYSDSYVKWLIRAGADGYFDLRKGGAVFVQELKSALKGAAVKPARFEGITLDAFPENNGKLTKRDMEIVHLILGELENKQIAAVLRLAEQSVKNRRKAIYEKLQVTNAVGLIKKLVRKRLIDMDELLNDYQAASGR